MDGNGSIQCNHWREQIIQYRLIMKMKNTPANQHMLQCCSKHVGGQVRKNDKFVCWVENNHQRIWKICEIFQRYPPLTSRMQCQYAFLKECGKRNDVHWMLRERKHKYLDQEKRIADMSTQSLLTRCYFSPWCSGFLEAGGCFSAIAAPSFSIGQSDDHYLLNAVREKFAGVNRVRLLKKKIYHWQVYRKSVLQNLIAHCKEYPLLGEKKWSFQRFLALFLSKKKERSFLILLIMCHAVMPLCPPLGGR